MNTGMNGKVIKQICLFGDTGDRSASPFISQQDKQILYLSASYHGDHDEFWVVVEKDGKEVERHNCRNVACIVWM